MISYQLHRDEGLLVVHPEGKLQASDFERLAREVDPYLEEAGELRGLLIDAKAFPGWEGFDAFVSHLRFVRAHLLRIRRVAVLSDSRLLRTAPAIADHFVDAEIRHFAHEKAEEARAWLTEQPLSVRAAVQQVVEGIRSGRLLETFDAFYAEDVVMSENGVQERVGKAANREYEARFVEGVEFHSATVGAVLVDGDRAAVEWTFDFTPAGGDRVVQKQVALQTWRDGRIVREVFYHG